MYYPNNFGGKRQLLTAIPTIFDVKEPIKCVELNQNKTSPPSKSLNIKSSKSMITNSGIYKKIKRSLASEKVKTPKTS